jgi:tetratricopeptide (TPR) repeat protein
VDHSGPLARRLSPHCNRPPPASCRTCDANRANANHEFRPTDTPSRTLSLDRYKAFWREGGYDESRVQLKTALQLLAEDNDELRAVLLIRAAIVEADSHRFEKALRLYNEALPLVERTQDHALRGSFHVNYGLLLRRLATPEDREQYIDRALIEYAAASFHFEQAGNTRAQARVEANLGYLFFAIDRYADAHTHLNRAHYLFLDLKDVGNAAKVNDTRARTLIAQDQMIEAERIARAAVRTLQRGGEQAV